MRPLPHCVIAGCLCIGLLAGCYSDPHFGMPQLFVPGATPAQKTAYEQAESQRFDPYPDPSLSHSDGGMRPLGYDQPREPYPLRPSPNPIIVTPAPSGTITAPYPGASGFPTTAPGSFPAASPAPYPGATPNYGTQNWTPVPGPAPAPYVLPQ